jgi:hypothetical protein
MRLTMSERRAVTKEYAARYRKASRKEKARMLTDLVGSTDYNRVYASWLLRGHGKRVLVKPDVLLEGDAVVRTRPPRRHQYGPDVAQVLTQVWETMDYICGKRLVAVLPEVLARLVEWGEMQVAPEVYEKLLRASASTIDRLLAPERRKHALKGRSRTKPGTLLKHQIPVRTFSQWDDAIAGFLEVDLVGHDGGSSAGDYCQTLDATDVATTWSEQVAVRNKAQQHVFEAIRQVRRRLPFELRGLDSDNGGEFINDQLARYCSDEKITFTRSRAGRKNDNCYVEQKNWSVVRRFAGYARFEGESACRMLNRLYDVLSNYANFFMPTMKCVEKTREGSRVTKHYDAPKTPYQRVLDSAQVDPAAKQQLKARYRTLNPAGLHRDILRFQNALSRLTARVDTSGRVRSLPGAQHPWRQPVCIQGARA